ncbi:alpha- and gamma-adaptin-binding protein p34-like [Vanessa cardui]|uniref:alpha- and gamma-adaptin-binding protein p34-like n=1 Tax=Vanessa cardui TaxID=171605 RepID=UPI001F12E013|nr:alpha- and gamma-adaptin-binding protein p34-like [Vanessa cardui]
MEACADITINRPLPIILISAFDLTSASVLLSEIIGEKILENDGKITQSRVWSIINKYYRVDVEMYSVADNESPPPTIADQIEAHIIFITKDEDNDNASEVAEQLWARAAAGERAHVRLLVTAGARAPPALLAWARRRRYELVPLRESADDSDDDADAPFPDTYGAERVRAALHAHAWRGLERLDRPAHRAPARALAPADVTSSDEEYEGVFEEEEEDDEGAVERAEAFAEALGALGAAGAEARGLARAERLRRAESLVAAFCRALGADLPAL